MIGGEALTGDEAARHNAAAWLALSDDDLVRCSASLGLPANLHVEGAHLPPEFGAVAATRSQIAELREAADAVAREHAGAEFVDAWIADNRQD